jgi:hypothetical protein
MTYLTIAAMLVLVLFPVLVPAIISAVHHLTGQLPAAHGIPVSRRSRRRVTCAPHHPDRARTSRCGSSTTY